MRVVAKRSLKAFWEGAGRRDAKAPLESWYEEAQRSNWTSPHSVQLHYATASFVGRNRVVFNIGGNKYRLVAEMQYRAGIVWVKFIGTHAAYDSINVETVNDY